MLNLSTTFYNFLQNIQNADDNKLLNLLRKKDPLDDYGPVQNIRNLISEDIRFTKIYLLDLLIDYANYMLKDNFISQDEIMDFTFLKKIFKIKEGDFFQLKNIETIKILEKQFLRMYSDKFITEREQMLSINLQDLFDMTFDEFEDAKRNEIIVLLRQGINPKDLDISKLPAGFKLK